MTRRVLVVIGIVAGALLLSVSIGSATLPKAPVVTGISPKKLAIGEVLTIRGRNFVPGKFKNTVAFQRPRSQAVFLRADSATKTTIRIRLTTKLLPFLTQKGGVASATRFQIRVLARRFGLSFTNNGLSPVIGPPTSKTPPPTASSDCDHDGIPNSQESDDDNDLLPDALELKYKLDPCNPDSDRDGMEDGWEYYSALDLNSKAVPYPGKRPYPNPLDGSDAGYDHDGDGLTQIDEYNAWARYARHSLNGTGDLLYSDGTQNSDGGAKPVPADKPWLDIDGNGSLTDDERDVDNDGLSNWVEVHGPGVTGWWKKIWDKETPFWTPFPEVDWLDQDTDGDGVPDGIDDQDHDDWSNIQEMQIGDRVGESLFGQRSIDVWTQPYNPCLPDWRSRSCTKHPPPPPESFPPFDDKTPKPLPILPYGGHPEQGLHWPIDWP